MKKVFNLDGKDVELTYMGFVPVANGFPKGRGRVVEEFESPYRKKSDSLIGWMIWG